MVYTDIKDVYVYMYISPKFYTIVNSIVHTCVLLISLHTFEYYIFNCSPS